MKVRLRALKRVACVPLMLPDQHRRPAQRLGRPYIFHAIVDKHTSQRIRRARSPHGLLEGLGGVLRLQVARPRINNAREEVVDANALEASLRVFGNGRREHEAVGLRPAGCHDRPHGRVLVNLVQRDVVDRGEVLLDAIARQEPFRQQPFQTRPMCFIKFISFGAVDAQFGLRVLRDFLRQSISGLPVVPIQSVVAVEEDEFGVGWRVGGHFWLCAVHFD
mmetsp:Transcript_10316/g.30279  ORF Transcript_10316/g.30279 Transcript_10316/m.30279 type:complete len:220 (+) Transcript_10316:111-770(+)